MVTAALEGTTWSCQDDAINYQLNQSTISRFSRLSQPVVEIIRLMSANLQCTISNGGEEVLPTLIV